MAGGLTLGNKSVLIGSALIVQGVVLSAGWLVTFRVVQRTFGQVIQDRTIEQTREYAARIASLIPSDAAAGADFGTEPWSRLQSYIELDAFKELPDGGFACIIEPDGQILCHPEISDNPSIRNYTFKDKRLVAGLERGAASVPLLTAGGDAGAGGVVEFAGDNFHYVATQPLPGSNLRLLVHQPADSLIAAGESSTRWVMGVASLAALGVLGVTGTGLGWLLHRYDGVHEALNRQLKQNLAVARTIQQKSLPADIPRPAGLAVAGWSRPAEETGGDTFDLSPLSDSPDATCRIGGTDAGEPSRIAFLLADATGHGVGPAIAVTQLNSMTRLARRVGTPLVDAARLINEQLFAALPGDRFVTAVFGTADGATGDVELFSAGQGPLLLFRAADRRAEVIETNTYPLGVMEDLGSDRSTRLRLEPGDLLCIVSDGIIEAAGPGGEQFGTGRLEALVSGMLDEHPGAVADSIGRAVDAFTAGAEPNDDRTVLLIKKTDPTPPATGS